MKDKHFEEEEIFHEKERKLYRKERKILSQKDRSKYKKTDLEKKQIERPSDPNLKQGRVLAIMADGILVDHEDTLYTCSLKGALKKENKRIKNLVAVGDFVLFAPMEDLSGSIAFVEERHSVLSRAEQITRQKEQLIAVNIDQVLITVSVVLPPLKHTLIDRYIIAALKGNMTPCLVINKIDLLEEDPVEKALFEEVVSIYQSIDIAVFPVSSKTGKGIESLKAAMAGKSSVFSGQSGTGKTSLINAITGSSFLTGEVIERTRKGMHTTTFTQLLPIEGDGFCIDTPGIKSFGMWELSPEEVGEYFEEIAKIATHCKFKRCTHMHEPECAVQEALEEGRISRLRFDSYCALMASLKEDQRRDR